MAKIRTKVDTIAAISTAFGEGAVGIVRLSGPDAVAIADSVFLSKNRKSLSTLSSFSLRYGWVLTDKRITERDNFKIENFKDRIIDEVIVSLMRASEHKRKQAEIFKLI